MDETNESFVTKKEKKAELSPGMSGRDTQRRRQSGTAKKTGFVVEQAWARQCRPLYINEMPEAFVNPK